MLRRNDLDYSFGCLSGVLVCLASLCLESRSNALVELDHRSPAAVTASAELAKYLGAWPGNYSCEAADVGKLEIRLAVAAAKYFTIRSNPGKQTQSFQVCGGLS